MTPNGAASADGPITIGLIDGPVDSGHPDLRGASIEPLDGARHCRAPDGLGCRHGTFIAALLLGREGARRAEREPRLVSRPLFCDREDFAGCPLVGVEQLAEAVREVVDAGARVVNLSVGLNGPTTATAPLYAAYDHARRRGALVVVAAGNQGRDGLHPLLDHPWVIPVGAADAHGRLSERSNRGPALRRHGLLAPARAEGPLAGGERTAMEGTSTAAALVSGALARLWARHPRIDAEALRRAILRPALPRGGTTPPMLNERESEMNLSEDLQPQQHPEPIPEPPAESTAAAAVPATVETPPPVAPRTTPAQPPQAVLPQGACAAAAAMAADHDYVYAVGHLRPTFPSLDVEREFRRVADDCGLPEDDYYGVLSQPQYRYLANAVCWVLAINNVDSYVIRPRSPLELTDCVDSLKVSSTTVEPPYSVVIGPRGPLAPPSLCNGLALPMVLLNQLYFFDFNALIQEMTKDTNIENESVVAVLRAMELKPNPGASDEDRALNYIACRFPEIYKKATQMSDPNQPPTGRHFLRDIETRPSPMSGGRRIVDVIFNYQQYDTGEQTSWYCGIDVTGQFPFVNTKLRIFVPERR